MGAGAQMSEVAGRADAFTAEVTALKKQIHALMAANQATYAQIPADLRAMFVQQVAGLVDRMKGEAAARVAGGGRPS